MGGIVMIAKSRALLAILALLLPLLGSLATPSPAHATILLEETFRGTTAPNWTFGAVGSSALPFLTAPSIDADGQGWLRLTTTANDQSGFAFYDNPIASGNGFRIEFDFAIWGGTGADGISFFLMDGSIASPQPGGFGGSLGYAQRFDTARTPPLTPGLTGGYVGIGLDEFGNYSNPTEGRIGGPGFRPNAVAIRGPWAPNDPALGYNYLDGATLAQPLAVPNPPPGQNHPDQSGADYRHAIITITPTGEITVQIQFGVGNPPVTVINNFPIGAPAPPTVRFGFAASTGGQTNFHEIRNFIVTELNDVAISKTHTGDFTAGGQGSFTITVSNVTAPPSTASAGPLTVTDTLPAGLSFVSGTGSGWTCSAAGQDVTCTNPGPLAVGASSDITLTVNVDAGAGPNVTNTATVASQGDTNPNNDSATDTAQVVAGSADLAISKTDSADPVAVGDPVSYTITVTNGGPDSATNVTVDDTFSGAGFSVTGVSSSQGGCAGFPCNLGTIASGGSATITINGTATGQGTITNTATVSSDQGDPNTNNNSATQQTSVGPTGADLAISKTDSADPAPVGGTVTYTITVTNGGPASATNVTVTDSFGGAGFTVTGVSSSQGGCAGFPCNLGTIASGGSATISVQGTATSAGTIINVASVSAAEADPNPNNNTVTQQTGVGAPATPVAAAPGQALLFDPAMSKIGFLQPGGIGLPGERLTWELTIANTGSATGSNIVVTDTVQPELRVEGASIDRGTATVNGQNVTFVVPYLDPGEAIGARIVTTVLRSPADGLYRNEAVLNGTLRAEAQVSVPTRLPGTGYPPAGAGEAHPAPWLLMVAGLIMVGLALGVRRR